VALDFRLRGRRRRARPPGTRHARTALLLRPRWIQQPSEGDLTTIEELEQDCFARLRSGRRELRDRRRRRRLAIGPPADRAGVPAAQLLFEIAPGQTSKEVELELAHDLYIRGAALDPDGAPARDIRVSCVRRKGVLAHFEREVWTGRNGSFVLGPLIAGEYTVTADDDRSRSDAALHGASSSVQARAGDAGVLVQLRWAGTLAGSGVDAETGKPVEADVIASRHARVR
jgi:hypothetical protein